MVLQIKNVDQLSSICSQAFAREGEIRSNTARPSAEPAAPATDDAKASRAEAEAVCEIPTSSEDAIVEDVDAIRSEARDDDLPITSAHVAGDMDDEDDEEDDEDGDASDLPDFGSDLDDDNDDDDDEDGLTIQYQRPTTTTKELS
ncbi:uncharacterized protein LOC112503724 [Cynara cardunculus var. scolymus]|uniref:uncharacterized protein LOC112503724 n=1 Tax=Cynara cardunculus var. scolymus TaxID=59895 RepID=UPI000D631665|nr:uncharacterized protein LOC112503724 [Cynara cardunculus var. scolymus]